MVPSYFIYVHKYFRVQTCSKSSMVMFCYNYLSLRLIRLIIFVFLINRIRNIEKFQIRRKIRYLEFRVLQLFPSKRKFRPRN